MNQNDLHETIGRHDTAVSQGLAFIREGWFKGSAPMSCSVGFLIPSHDALAQNGQDDGVCVQSRRTECGGSMKGVSALSSPEEELK